ncbi:SoxR reducing system RseC family protein [Vibrio sp. SCSIO 43136]|uniref:SoxR reducing system RseC family protein n=1 Tax=Vibrio sp. SCSIO 43136 TaxID=2819101 RepID=UPI0020756C69|nr:SoxR reducing system RseC family protein [Vibrio sp. SCSIO 43136]USD65652.1 SoxR reducing system RseC family protein [Vibrio sp. SCSIO 43136]
MMTALATVQEVQTAKQGFLIRVSCEQQTSCSHCSSQNSCGTGIVSKAVGNKQHTWWLESDKSLSVGQVIEIGLPENRIISSAAIVYLLPLFTLFLGAALAHLVLAPMLGFGEGLVILISAAFAYAGFKLAQYLSAKQERESPAKVSLIRILGEPLTVNASFEDSSDA